MRMTGISALAVAALAAGGAQAGGFFGGGDVAPPGAPVVMPSTGFTWGGVASAGIGWMDFTNTDDSYTDDDDDGEQTGLSARKLDGQLQFGFGGVYGLLDASRRTRDIGEEDFDEYAPSEVTAMGLHLGYDLGLFSLGGFVGRNEFEIYDGDYGTETGSLRGVEIGIEPTEGVLFFTQLGSAEMVGDADDTAFDGTFSRVGLSADVGRIGFTVEGERGESPDIFEDTDDPGYYTALSASADYEITQRISASVGVETMDVDAEDPDHGRETTVFLGVSFAFGNTTDRSPMDTTWRPGLAAAWAETLD